MKIASFAAVRLWLCLAFAVGFTFCVQATVTNVAWYRLGENDPGALSGQTAKSSTIDFVGNNDLKRFGSPHYTNNVSSDAAQIGSTLAVLFNGASFYSNAVVTTARNNFGVEAWVRTLTAPNGVYYIAHNGNATVNGWGLWVSVTNQPSLGTATVTYSGELGGGTRIGSGGSGFTSRAEPWRHVALVRDNGTSTFYLDGVASGSTSTTTPATPAGGFTIAGSPQVADSFLPGIIDEVRVFTFAPGQFNPNDLLVNQPVVTTLAASGLAPGTVTLNGRASPFGFTTTVWFEWGTTPTNLNNITPAQGVGSGFNTTNFSAMLTGLPAGITHYFRAVGTNDLGLAFGNTRTFILGPIVETLPPSGVTPTAATFNGVINPNGTDTTAWFEFGFSTNYGFFTAPQALGSFADTNISTALTSLIPSVVYHFRAAASNAFGVVFGADQSFPKFAQRDYVKASNTAAYFGGAVAIDGDTMVIGAAYESTSAAYSGAAYVFVRNGDSWIQQAFLKASNAESDDEFGSSVAISGDTIVIGAPNEDSNATGVNGNQSDNSATNSGAAYVFVRNGTNWTQQAYLKAADAVGVCSTAGCSGGCFCYPGDRFGSSVSISGDTVVVGAPGDDSSATGLNGNATDNNALESGAAYVFVRSGTTWTQQAYLKASNTGGAPPGVSVGDLFGSSVAVSGDTVVIGAPGEDGNATGINGDQSNNSATAAGAAYVFVRSGTTWTQQAYLKASNTDASDVFGSSVAVSSDTIVVGAPQEDSNATGVNGDQNNNSAGNSGAAYVFVRNGTTWTQQAYLKASNTGASDLFGGSVSIASDTVVVGARLESSNATGVDGDGDNDLSPQSGAAYVFTRTGTTWSFQNYLKASNTEKFDLFGISVAVSGELVVVGAEQEGSNARGINGDQANNNAPGSGAAYVFGPPRPPFGEILVELSNANVVDGDTAPQFVTAVGHVANNLTFTIKNTGNDFLTPLTITLDGPDVAAFGITASPRAPLEPTSNTTFTVRFAPTSTGTKTSALRIASNDADENPFNIQLSGLSLSFTEDRDGDGLSDASEFLMSSLGFNFQVKQTSLVNALFNNLGGVAALGASVSNLNAVGLFTQSQLQALNVDSPLLAKDPATGLFKLTIGVEKATQLTNFFPFPMTAPQTTINADGKLEFQFSSPDSAAFFRLESR